MMSHPTIPNSDSSIDVAQASRITVEEATQPLNAGRLAVYSMPEAAILPGIGVGRRYIIARRAFEKWERTRGMRSRTGLRLAQEVMVVH